MNLPEPSIEEQQHSLALIEHLKPQLPLSFADYMQQVLYAPGLGYYVAGKKKFGEEGDFVTAPEISPLFSQCLAKQCQPVLQQTQGNILEFGAGSGKMAADILLQCEADDCLPPHYFILEPSPDLQSLQRETLQQRCPDLVNRVQWLSSLPIDFVGVMLANEVLDAMPVELFQWDGNSKPLQGFVRIEDCGLRIEFEESKHEAFLQALKTLPSENFSERYTSEINLMIQPWLQSLADCMKQGQVILIDYGFLRDEYYHPQRNQGTLMCHYKHHNQPDPLVYPSLQDVTAHVDFTAVGEAAEQVGFDVQQYTNQANYLLEAGLLELMQLETSDDEKKQLQLSQQVKKLIQPHEMGELFKVMVLEKG